MTAHTLILLRHGESDWNQKNLFTGWVDVDLTEKGRAEAVRGGQLMAEAGLLPDVVHTSVLRRAINTANLALDACDRHWIPVRRSWRLNERHYGALQGLDKAATREQVRRRAVHALAPQSFDTPPPPIEAGREYDQTGDPRYAGIDVPLTECLKDVIPRMMPYWENEIQHRPDRRPHGARHRPRQLAAGAGQAPRRHQRRRHRRTEHPHRACRSSTASATTSCRPAPASTSTRRPRPRQPPRSRTRAAEPRGQPNPGHRSCGSRRPKSWRPRPEPGAVGVPEDEPVDAGPPRVDDLEDADAVAQLADLETG